MASVRRGLDETSAGEPGESGAAETVDAARTAAEARAAAYAAEMAKIEATPGWEARQKELEPMRQARAARLAEEAARLAEKRTYEERYGPPSSLIGLQQTNEAFECAECGRWADVASTAEVYSRLVMTRLGFSLAQWDRVKSSAARSTPLRPAFLQREFGKTYDESVATIDAAVWLGLLDVMKKGVVAAQPRCAPCYQRRAAASEPGQSEPKARDPIPPQLRFRVLQRDGFRCQYCGRSARDGATLHLDHVVPASAGGETSEENLITACETCNLGKSAGSVI